MAYETGSTSGIEDLVTKLFTFATGLTTTPWTQDELDTGANNRATLHRGSCYVSFGWDATAASLGIAQSLGYTAGQPFYNHLNDSGNADSTPSTLDSGRRVNFGSSGPGWTYYFFAGEGATPYIHVVVEVSSGLFRHFGFGNLVKLGTWTGGEYCYGHLWSTSDPDNVTYVQHSFGLDGVYTGSNEGATMHVEGLPEQAGTEKWGQFCDRTSGGTDRAGNARRVLSGGSRGGFWGRYLGWIRSSTLNAYKPLIPIPVALYDTAAAPDTWRWLGHQPDVAIVNMASYTPKQEISVGAGETWVVFPWVRKQYLQASTDESWNAGIAYKKVT